MVLLTYSVPHRMKPTMMDGWQKISFFSSTEGCVYVMHRTSVAFFLSLFVFFFLSEENLMSNLTYTKMAKSIKLQCEDGSGKCSPITYLTICSLQLPLFPFSDTLTVVRPSRMKLHVSCLFSHILF